MYKFTSFSEWMDRGDHWNPGRFFSLYGNCHVNVPAPRSQCSHHDPVLFVSTQ